MGRIIRGKEFTEAEFESYKRKYFRENAVPLLVLGIIALVGGIIFMILNFMFQNYIAFFIFAIAIIGIGVAFLISFFLKYSKIESLVVEELTNNFPFPIGFDEKIVELISFDKKLILSSNPESFILFDFKNREFQIMIENRYSPALTSKDIIEYIIVADEKIIASSQTNTGFVKALAGGLLFGGAGTIAGALAGNKTTTTSEIKTHRYTFIIKINYVIKPVVTMELENIGVCEELKQMIKYIETGTLTSE